MRKKCVLYVGAVIAVIAILWPSRHARYYEYIQVENVHDQLRFEHIETNRPNLKYCDYEAVILNNGDVAELETVPEEPLHGGEFIPSVCNPLLKVAVIIPYRNRSQQLHTFLTYMHGFLQRQFLFYRIFVVNQTDNLAFNRAKMLNYGAKVAMDMGFPCLILHDVDLLPLTTGNIYGCGKKPRHMSSSLDTFRFNLPYLGLFGGAVSISSQHFQLVNGLSNQFYGWGAEDDDFFNRLKANNIIPCRFAPSLSKYTMLFHKKEKPSRDRIDVLKKSLSLHKQDGLSSLPSNYTVKLERLYTLVNAS